MAQAIMCDADQCGMYANILITNLDNGEVQAFCHGHYAELIFTIASTMVQNELDNMPVPTDGNGQPVPSSIDNPDSGEIAQKKSGLEDLGTGTE